MRAVVKGPQGRMLDNSGEGGGDVGMGDEKERNSVKIKLGGAAAAGNEKVDGRELSIPVTGFIPFGSRDTRNGHLYGVILPKTNSSSKTGKSIQMLCGHFQCLDYPDKDWEICHKKKVLFSSQEEVESE
ncbi:hypothetical protein PV327_000852 [Microctonus hyperodae]|uniref:Uncharacterized protein n=1 Tax=Microctonus hyperodae TaxID=165561 RepID=A0AA39G7I7_MICHY|nr:hypothetical protein PV327_000852 [Microctonus hyperodae]